MEYYFNHLDPVAFQRLVNVILVARFGEDARLTPLRGSDGGSDGETAPGNPYFEYQVTDVPSLPSLFAPIKQGRYVFQVKHHRTVNKRLSDVRQNVVNDFEDELVKNVLSRTDDERVNYFILITNVPNSRDAKNSIDKKRKELLSNHSTLHADVWWEEHVIAYLDQMPALWNAFPQMFAGNQVPILAGVAGNISQGLPRALRIAISTQYTRDSLIKFRQIDLERNLFKLFVDLDVDIEELGEEEKQRTVFAEIERRGGLNEVEVDHARLHRMGVRFVSHSGIPLVSALSVLLDENKCFRKLIIEGGPGQGKSTVTQMATQIYREQILGDRNTDPEGRWTQPQKSRLPLRIELKDFAEWLISNQQLSVEEYLAAVIKQDSGGRIIPVDDIQTMVEHSPILLIFDGLDEVGNDDTRDLVLVKINECVDRFENALHADVRVIVTTRPPAIAGRRERLVEFLRLPIAEMGTERIDNYLNRWLLVQEQEEDERVRIRKSFERRRKETHVQALAKNPMQLSVLLHFIKLKGEAFPTRRAELYRDYFQIVIDRDVEKSTKLSEQREIIEQLHQYLGYKIHALTEAEQADGSLQRSQLLQLVREWLKLQGNDTTTAHELFKLGEERLGLIVTLRGEGNDTWHGFAIQPVREYFAAAFINYQIEGNAHDVFEAMVRRPYWREVSLFLAGLRRPNEKADLVSRAKSLDADSEFGWKQSGRALTLQLLQEGVFSHPRHVFVDAVDFVFDLLDTKVIKAQNQPKNFLNALAAVVKEGRSEKHIERIITLLRLYDTSTDEYTLHRLYRVATELLFPLQLIEESLKYRGISPDLVMKVRLVWPCLRDIDIKAVTLSPSFWQVAPDHTIAYWWLFAATDSNIATSLQGPVNLHQSLLEQFVANASPNSNNPSPELIQPLPESKWVVWELIRLETLFANISLHSLRYFRELSKADMNSVVSSFNGSLKFEYNGLDEDTVFVVKTLLTASYDVLRSLHDNMGRGSDALLTHVESITQCLSLPGFQSWLTCRITVCLLRLVLMEQLGIDRDTFYMKREGLADTLDEYAKGSSAWSLMWKEISDFYNIDLNMFIEESTRLDFYLLARSYPYETGNMVPKKIRTRKNGDLISVVDLLSRYICNGEDLPFDWIAEMQFTTAIIRPLTEKCVTCLPNLFKFFHNIRMTSFRPNAPLRTPHIQRIVKCVRSTNDPELLDGAFVALSTSRFLSIAGTELTLKLLHSTRDRVSFISMLFRDGFRNAETENESKILLSISKQIVSTPDGYSFRVVCEAANYISEHSTVTLPPMLSEERRLGIKLGDD